MRQGVTGGLTALALVAVLGGGPAEAGAAEAGAAWLAVPAAGRAVPAAGVDPTVAAALPIGLMPLGLAAGVGLPLIIGGGDQGPLAATLGLGLGVLGAASGHLYAGDPWRGVSLAALGSGVAVGAGVAGFALGMAVGGSSAEGNLLSLSTSLLMGTALAGWTGYMAWDAHRVAEERR
ncbi:MAG: hypothetical protein VKQ33_05280 [Candidatus Sericytochromatia bacterium]|nr:hypothetical protein [Candidatus Sericytochromatia bacterium]